MNDPKTSPAFRLIGEISGAPRTFSLTAEVTQVGSHSGNDLVLDAAGVSRHHAVLRLEAGGVELEDVGSKNGSFINGSRTERGRLVAGDELTVGSVCLRLEAAHPQDGHLALTFDGSGSEMPEPSGRDLQETDLRQTDLRETDLRETDLIESGVAEAPLLDWLQEFVGHLASRGPLRMPDALATVCAGFGARAVAAVSFSRGKSPALAGHALAGHAGDRQLLDCLLDEHLPVLERAAERAVGQQTWQLEVIGSEGPVVGLMPRQGEEVLALAVVGDLPGRATCGPLLRLLGTLLVAVDPLSPDRGMAERARAEAPGLDFPEGHVRGLTPGMRRLYREMETVAGGGYPVLILGETGCGKEMIAQTLHRSSPRAAAALVVVNCAAIPGDLLEAEMFGVERGAATGVSSRPGCFTRADGGTLFLDEVGELHSELQAKLLRALEYGEVQPVGGVPTQVDVRVLSATNVDLEQRIADGGFRADLYYRLAASVLEVPPLRQRREDIPRLIQAFVQTLSAELDVHLRGVTQRALDLLLAYPWPGNVRELHHELRRAVQKVAPGQALDSSVLSGKLLNARPAEVVAEKAAPAADDLASLDLRKRVAELESRVIGEALQRSGGNRTVAAQLLGVSRNTLATKIALYDLM